MEALDRSPQALEETGLANRLLGRLESCLLNMSILAVLAMGAVIVGTILGRWLLGGQIPDDVLWVKDLMVAAVALPLASVAAARQNIVVEVFTNGASEKAKAVLDFLGNLLGFAMFVLLSWGSWTEFLHVWADDSYYDGDLYLMQWPGHLVCAAGFSVLTLRLAVAMFGRAVSLSPIDEREV
ncbi:MAG: TRAP transporter small permease subunit [Rhodospirillales bacterium]|jgi:TRAP-type C4-dicarboxylate transport system permease small subunit